MFLLGETSKSNHFSASDLKNPSNDLFKFHLIYSYNKAEVRNWLKAYVLSWRSQNFEHAVALWTLFYDSFLKYSIYFIWFGVLGFWGFGVFGQISWFLPYFSVTVFANHLVLISSAPYTWVLWNWVKSLKEKSIMLDCRPKWCDFRVNC